MEFEDLAKKIIYLKDQDLKLRDELIQKGQLSKGYHPEMEKVHIRNAETLDDIIDKIGYPSIQKVGKEANGAAWLIIQHAISKPSFMKRCLALLEIEVATNHHDPIQLAYLSDRIAVFEDKLQLYGTQFDWDEHGDLNPQAYDDITMVNQRRKLIGLNTLEEQINIMRTRAEKEKESCPPDLLKRNADMKKWKKEVGWIK